MNHKIIPDFVFYNTHGTFDVDELNQMETTEEFLGMCVKKFCNLMKDFDERFSEEYLDDNGITKYLVNVFHLDLAEYAEDLKDILFSDITKQIKLMLFAFAFIDTLSEDKVASDFIKEEFYKKFEGFNEQFIKALREEFNKKHD